MRSWKISVEFFGINLILYFLIGDLEKLLRILSDSFGILPEGKGGIFGAFFPLQILQDL